MKNIVKIDHIDADNTVIYHFRDRERYKTLYFNHDDLFIGRNSERTPGQKKDRYQKNKDIVITQAWRRKHEYVENHNIYV